MGRPSLIVAILLGALQSAALVAADITIDPNSLSVNTRMSWCDQQMTSCGLLCGEGGTDNNSCDHNTLKHACQCSDGTAPRLASYTGTMPTLICLKASEDCRNKATTNTVPQGECTPDMKSQCGTLDPAYTEKVSGTNTVPMSAPTDALTEASAAATSPVTGKADEADEADGLGTTAVVGIAIGVSTGAVLTTLALGYGLYRQRRRRHETSDIHAGAGPFSKLGDEGSRLSAFEMQTQEPAVELNARQSTIEMPGSAVIIAELDGSPMPSPRPILPVPVSPIIGSSVPSSPLPVSPLPAASSLASLRPQDDDEWDYRKRRNN